MTTDVLARCAYCPRLCADVCPVVRAEHRETVSPTALMTMLLLEREGALSGDAVLGEIMHHCIDCGRCTETCRHDARPQDAFLDARARLPVPGDKAHPAANGTGLWQAPPFKQAGAGLDAWLLVGTLTGLDAKAVKRRLAADAARTWRLPKLGLPVLFYRAWATGETELFASYAAALREEVLTARPDGIAWSDPHEGRAVQALGAAIGWDGPTAYAPQLLGLVAAERTGCTDLHRKWGCCGAAGGYPHAAPDGAAELAANYEGDPAACLPGLCVAHLARHDRPGFRSDWDAA